MQFGKFRRSSKMQTQFIKVVIMLLITFSSLFAEPTKEIIKTQKAPEPIGPYSQAVKYGDLLFVSGQIALDPKTNELVNTSIEAETRQVLENLKAIVLSAGFELSKTLKATIYLTDLNDFKKVNEVYGEYFSKNPPARETVQVAKLPKSAKVEISLIVGK